MAFGAGGKSASDTLRDAASCVLFAPPNTLKFRKKISQGKRIYWIGEFCASNNFVDTKLKSIMSCSFSKISAVPNQ